jgi:Fe-S-cluster containining protein
MAVAGGAVSTCDTCRSPGSCCNGLVLNRHFSSENWRDEAREFVNKYGIHYLVPVRPHAPSNDGTSTAVMFDCTRLGVDGRCTDYENRPELCRIYEPASDRLCAEYVHTLAGIPIRTVHA